MMDFVTVCPPEGDPFRHELPSGRTLRIGRAHANDIILKDLNISRLHAEILWRDDGYYVVDAGGKNGVFLNDRRLTEATLLRAGDRVRLGGTTLIFNGAAGDPIEFIDEPLPNPAGATFIDARTIQSADLLTPVTPGSGAGTPTPRPPTPAEAADSRSLNIIFEADQELVFHRPVEEILETIMDLAGRAAPFERGVLMLLENSEPVPKVLRMPAEETGKPISISRTIVRHVVGKQESVLASDALLDERFREGKSIEAQQIHSVMCVPLWNNREVIGVIYVDNRRRKGLFNESALRVLTHLANVAAVKLENARLFEQAVAAELMQQDLQRAAEIQRQLLPGEGPAIGPYQVVGTSLPCRTVGGDYYDYLALPDGRIGIAVGDVAGKGLPASLLMCSFQASLRAYSETDLPLEQLIVRINRDLCRRIPANRFITFFYGILDPQAHTLTYVNAGHNPPAIIHSDATFDRLSVNGRPLGLFESFDFTASSVPMRPGDVLLCYSDGVTEAQRAGEEEFGEARLITSVLEQRGGSPEEILHAIVRSVDQHLCGAPRQDDLTIVVVKRGV